MLFKCLLSSWTEILNKLFESNNLKNIAHEPLFIIFGLVDTMKKLLKHWKFPGNQKKLGNLWSIPWLRSIDPRAFTLLEHGLEVWKTGWSVHEGWHVCLLEFESLLQKGAVETPQRVRCALNKSCFCSFAWINKIRSIPRYPFIWGSSLHHSGSLTVACGLSSCGSWAQ